MNDRNTTTDPWIADHSRSTRHLPSSDTSQQPIDRTRQSPHLPGVIPLSSALFAEDAGNTLLDGFQLARRLSFPVIRGAI
jgi:hypothetical protein